MYFLYTIQKSTSVRVLKTTLFKNKSTRLGALIYIGCTKRQKFDEVLTFLGRFCERAYLPYVTEQVLPKTQKIANY